MNAMSFLHTLLFKTLGGLAVALLLAACVAPPQRDASVDCGLDAATRERASALVAAMVQRGHAPGVVADIRCNGKPWLQLAAGQADAAKARPMRQDDLFRIYSMTKPVTALAVLQLADDGRLALDDPVAKHLPEFATATVFVAEKDGVMQTAPLARPLTVRDLLRHTAGMPYMAPVPHPVFKRYVARGIDNGSGEKHKPGDGSAPIDSAADFSRRIASIPLLHQPGERHMYGSANDVAGRLVEAVSGQSLGAFMQQRLFAPLGMADTTFLVPPTIAPRMTVAYTAPSQRPNDGSVLHPHRIAELGPSKLTAIDGVETSVFTQPRPMHFGGAGLVSTAADFQRINSLLLDGNPRLVKPQSLAEMQRNQLPPAALENSTLVRQGLGYGLGIGVVTDRAKAPAPVPAGTVFWGGAASTFFWADRERRITGVLMTQVFGGDASPYFVELLNTLYAAPTK
jgi:CubicO group peptidase (beta-lactamase class C family)